MFNCVNLQGIYTDTLKDLSHAQPEKSKFSLNLNLIYIHFITKMGVKF